MSRRWVPVAALAVVLFAINAVMRLAVRFGFDGDRTAENRASLVMFGGIGAVMAIVAFLRSRDFPPGRWLPPVAVAALLGMLLTVFLGPFLSGDSPFEAGAGHLFTQVWLYVVFALGGVLLGYLIAIALGVDHRSKVLKAYAQARLAKPRRVIRR